MRKKSKLNLHRRKKKHFCPKQAFLGLPTGASSTKKVPSARKIRSTPLKTSPVLKRMNVSSIASPMKVSSKKKLNLKRSQVKGSPRKIQFTPTKSPHHKRLKPSKLSFTGIHTELNNPESVSFSGFQPFIDSDASDNDEIDIKVNTSSVEDECKQVIKSSEMSDDMKEMIRLIPVVLDKISTEGIEKKLFLDFFRQVSSNIYPVRNIAFLLWAEVVSWYNKDTSSAMRYSDETKKFWKLGYQLFGGKFVRFMSGFKNESQVVFGEAIKGQCAPDKADINFVVPTLRLLITSSARAFIPPLLMYLYSISVRNKHYFACLSKLPSAHCKLD